MWAGRTEEDAITLRQWMQQRPLHGSRSFLDFYEDDADECEESLEAWEADYRAKMAAAGLLVPQSYAEVSAAGAALRFV